MNSIALSFSTSGIPAHEMGIRARMSHTTKLAFIASLATVSLGRH